MCNTAQPRTDLLRKSLRRIVRPRLVAACLAFLTRNMSHLAMALDCAAAVVQLIVGLIALKRALRKE